MMMMMNKAVHKIGERNKISHLILKLILQQIVIDVTCFSVVSLG